MKRSILVVMLALLFCAGGVALAQTGGPFDLTWWTADGGGGTVNGGDYALMGTAGQPDAGAALSGGSYTLAGGFWVGGPAITPVPGHDVYLPIVLKNR
jgi:hypothetical protein